MYEIYQKIRNWFILIFGFMPLSKITPDSFDSDFKSLGIVYTVFPTYIEGHREESPKNIVRVDITKDVLDAKLQMMIILCSNLSAEQKVNFISIK